jgi:hypothetical protein
MRTKAFIRHILLALLAACLMGPISFIFAQNSDGPGGLAGAPMRMGFGARGIGMANALTAVRSDGVAGYYNPALVPFQARPSALLSTGFLPLDRRLNFVSYTQGLKPSGGFSIGIINAGVSNIEGRSSDGTPTQTYSTSENEFLLSFGVKPAERVAVGVSAKILYYSLFESVKSTTVGFDLGLIYVPGDKWTLGIVLSDINSKYKWDTSQLYGTEGTTTIDRFPLRREIAVSYAPGFVHGVIAGELESVGSTWRSRLGAEIYLHERFAVRGGIDQISFSRDISAKPSIGFSVRPPITALNPTLHYAYVFEPYSPGGIHLISLSLDFE